MIQTTILIAFFGVLIWIIFTVGIEAALAFGTVITGLTWLGYRLLKGKQTVAQAIPYLVDNARSFFPVFLVVLLLRGFLVEPFRIPSGSMIPTLLVGDFILVNKFSYGLRMPVTKSKILDIDEPQRGDVIVFRWPINPSLDYIKRLVGVPGDKVRYVDKTIHINGKPVALTPVGPYQPNSNAPRTSYAVEVRENLQGVEHPILVNPRAPDFGMSCNFMRNQEVEVPAGHYLVMGDNRDNSNDGRCWGFVPEENLVGKAFFIWFNWDWERSGFVDWQRIGQSIQ